MKKGELESLFVTSYDLLTAEWSIAAKIELPKRKSELI